MAFYLTSVLNCVVLFQGIGDIQLAYQCFRLALASNNDHAEAYNNLGVLEMRKGHTEQVLLFVVIFINYSLGKPPIMSAHLYHVPCFVKHSQLHLNQNLRT